MSHNGPETTSSRGATSFPQRSRHQITRSISELSSPIRLHRHHSHRVAGKERDQQHQRDTLSPVRQSPGPMPLNSTNPPQQQGRLSFDGSLSGAAMTPSNLSPNPSRRTSILIPTTDVNNNPIVTATTGGAPAAAAAALTNNNTNTSSKEDEAVVKERQKASARESGLRTSLSNLEVFQTSTTRRLDDTYYSVLERLGALQSTIVALKELAGLSCDMNDTFTTKASELASDIGQQLDTFGQFEDQQQRIERLQGRVHVGRDRIRGLSERVDRVRERIERWERADREWQERTRKRLRVVWILTSAVVFFMLLLVVSAQYAPVVTDMEGASVSRIANESLGALRNVTVGGKVKLWTGVVGGGQKKEGSSGHERPEHSTVTTVATTTRAELKSALSLALPSASPSGTDRDLLRAFDEL
ncbi:hypothetical protein B0H66DRAFT_23769 [Apodospora peruviana]|uniref:Uncharacterized protein n=1 Tax=Apodospora peruviana TaxID=516989 RepID=A0AAE0MF50_9PEZI|nr:hypothetical protein B0H66DRAFT_23769 [Apodospora peruviana]